jgi:hypothetical protein
MKNQYPIQMFSRITQIVNNKICYFHLEIFSVVLGDVKFLEYLQIYNKSYLIYDSHGNYI